MLYLWIIIIVVLIYLSFSCYESFATTPKAKAKPKSPSYTVVGSDSRNTGDLITNSLSVLNNGSVNGNFNVKGNFTTDGASTFKNGIDVNGYLRLNGQDVTNNQNVDLSQYVRQDNLASIISSIPSMNITDGKYATVESLQKYAKVDDLSKYATIESLNEIKNNMPSTSGSSSPQSSNNYFNYQKLIVKDTNTNINYNQLDVFTFPDISSVRFTYPENSKINIQNNKDLTINGGLVVQQMDSSGRITGSLRFNPEGYTKSLMITKNDVSLDYNKKYCIADSCITKEDIDKLKSLSSTPSS